MRHFVIILSFWSFLFAVLLLSGPSGYSLDGEHIFAQKCGKCHTGGGEAKAFAPVKYASVQWERFFERNKHKRKKDISGEISEEEMNAIKQYLVDHAADSDRPIAAGLR